MKLLQEKKKTLKEMIVFCKTAHKHSAEFLRGMRSSKLSGFTVFLEAIQGA